MVENILSEYVKKLNAAADEDAYKVYEEYAKRALGVDLKDMKDSQYWTVRGEAESFYGSLVVFENRETLLGKVQAGNRPKYLESLLEEVYTENVLALMPNKCGKCGFHRFFGLKIDVTSLGQYITVFCPNCKKQFGNIDADSGDIERNDG